MYSLLEKNGKWFVFTNIQGRDWYYGGYTSKVLAQLLLDELSMLEVA